MNMNQFLITTAVLVTYFISGKHCYSKKSFPESKACHSHNLKAISNDKTFRSTFFKNTIYFPLGAKLNHDRRNTNNNITIANANHNHQLVSCSPKIESQTLPYGSKEKCFTMTLTSPSESPTVTDTDGIGNVLESKSSKRNLQEIQLPFLCAYDFQKKLCCRLETKESPIDGLFDLWGYASILKTDNKSYVLVQTCLIDEEISSWILLSNQAQIPLELKNEILNEIQSLGFNPNDLMDIEQDSVALIKMKRCLI